MLRLLTHHHWLRLACGLCLALAASACQFTSLRGKPFLDDAALRANPPRSLAILPTTDGSGHPELSKPLRNALFSALAPLPYQDRELKVVDENLARLAARAGCSPEQLPREAMADAQLADCVVYSRLERISRLYLLLYSHHRMDLRLTMVDTRSKKVLYRDQVTFYDRIGMPSYSILGLLESAFMSLWHLRENQLDDTFSRGAKKIAERFPQPQYELAANGALRIDEAKVSVPDKLLAPGQRLVVKVKGTPGCRVTYSIGQAVRDQPTQEVSPGRYEGLYTVQPGSDTPETIVEVQLHAARGSAGVDYAVDDVSFAIDTQPPPRARVGHWWRGMFGSGLCLEFELNPADGQASAEKTAEYIIFRKAPGEGQFRRIGIGRDKVFRDETADPDLNYDYYVVTRDEAGNESLPWTTAVVPAKAD